MNVNLGSILVELSPFDLQEIETALSEIKVHGGRMSPDLMRDVIQST